MSEQISKPHLITKPIQLLAAWLVGLSVIDGSFLGAAKLIGTEHWECGALVVASILNVPVFISALFLLQTKFRPEMQEDSYYAQYIDKRTGALIHISRIELIEQKIDELRTIQSNKGKSRLVDGFADRNWAACSIAINDYLRFYKDLRQKLRDEGIPVISIFGRVNGTAKPPPHLLVSINEFNSQADLILLAMKVFVEFPFDGYKVESHFEDIDKEDIYVGTYGKMRDYVPLKPEVIQLFREATDPADFEYITKRYLIASTDPVFSKAD